MNKEMITVTNNGEHWICLCGNTTMGTGFDTCSKNGTYTEPLARTWAGYYACIECGRVIDQSNYEVITTTKDLSSFNI